MHDHPPQQDRRGPDLGARHGAGPLLIALVVVYSIVQHSGTAFSWLGELPGSGAVGQTRWADWIDLVTPYPLLGLCVAVLHRVGAERRAWVALWAGAITYGVGHGVHLAANSVGNVEPSDIAHLWDEAVGHYVTHTGVALLVVAVAAAVRGGRTWPPSLTIPSGLAIGVTHGTNALEGGTALYGLAVSAGLIGWGARRGDGVGRLLIVAYLVAALLIAGYGVWQGGFPQPSSVGIGG